MTETDLHRALVGEAERRLFDESVPRLKKCLGLLSEDEVWHRPNAHTASVGNLVLHLCGNLRQWVLSGLGGRGDSRERQAEFDELGPIPTAQLLDDLEVVEREVRRALQRLDADQLVKRHVVQGFTETGVGILVHVVEHFSYHVGQVSWHVKVLKDVDLDYYAGYDLNKTN